MLRRRNLNTCGLAASCLILFRLERMGIGKKPEPMKKLVKEVDQ
jgi:hypothetical protein